MREVSMAPCPPASFEVCRSWTHDCRRIDPSGALLCSEWNISQGLSFGLQIGTMVWYSYNRGYLDGMASDLATVRGIEITWPHRSIYLVYYQSFKVHRGPLSAGHRPRARGGFQSPHRTSQYP